ncbi:hypothetical protein [Cryptosporangium japonicum]|uniref:SdpI/YhfL family protein n=1 Tax=Cryptosporangium japonicum TaxID=80872 RepID=A0ABP3DT30_9ACTN
MPWVMFFFAGVAFGLAGLYAWAAATKRAPRTEPGREEHRDPSWRRELAWKWSIVRARPPADFWWLSAHAAFLGTGAAANGVAGLLWADWLGWSLPALSVLLMAWGVFGAVVLQKRFGDRRPT